MLGSFGFFQPSPLYKTLFGAIEKDRVTSITLANLIAIKTSVACWFLEIALPTTLVSRFKNSTNELLIHLLLTSPARGAAFGFPRNLHAS